MTVAVIGLGSIGMRHAKNLRALGQHVWGVDHDMSRRLEFGFNYSSNEFSHVLTADAFVIASPSHLHVAHLIACNNKPAFVEKPLDSDPAVLNVARAIMDKRRTNDCITTMGNNLRYHGCISLIKEHLVAGTIGEPVYASFSLGQYNEKYTESVILNWGAHEVDLALYLLGPAKVTFCKSEFENGIENVALLNMHHHSGANSRIHLDYVTTPQLRNFNIQGTKGAISCDLEEFIVDVASPEGDERTFCTGSFDKSYVDEMKEFIRRIEGHEPDGIGATGEDGLTCLELLLEAQRLAALGEGADRK